LASERETPTNAFAIQPQKQISTHLFSGSFSQYALEEGSEGLRWLKLLVNLALNCMLFTIQ